ncbi:MAG: GGDEF domain-containing protein [Casimicrobiaceae bacterium]
MADHENHAPQVKDQLAAVTEGTAHALALNRVLAQCRNITTLLDECTASLSGGNDVLRAELECRYPMPRVARVLEDIEAAKVKAAEASAQLLMVSQAVANAVRDRTMVDHQLAAAMEQEEAARHASFHDRLTGLPNRLLFDERLDQAFALAGRHGWTLAVMFVDLDDFKAINDSYGHDVGDDVLRTVARRLKATSRADDTVSRHGGDEFLCLLMDTAGNRAIATAAERFVRALEAPCTVQGRDVEVRPVIRASIGISIFPQDGTTANTLVSSADKAMYLAKRSRSRYAFACGRQHDANVR